MIPSQPMNPLLEPQELIPNLEEQYALEPPLECDLIRRGFNDHYHVRAGVDSYVLRVYFNGKYYISGDEDFQFELDLLDFVHRRGIRAANPLPNTEGHLLGKIEAGGVRRCCALFSFILGQRGGPVTPEQARSLGASLARFHLAADEFSSPHHRYHFNLEYLVERPLQKIGPVLAEHSQGDLEAYLPTIHQLTQQVRDLPTTAPEYGIIHGDCHLGNIIFPSNEEVVFIDFDHCGYGWRAYDIATCGGGMSSENWQQLLEGYSGVRLLTDRELQVIPVFQKLRPIWDVGDVLAMAPVWGDFQVNEKLLQEMRQSLEGVRG